MYTCELHGYHSNTCVLHDLQWFLSLLYKLTHSEIFRQITYLIFLVEKKNSLWSLLKYFTDLKVWVFKDLVPDLYSYINYYKHVNFYFNHWRNNSEYLFKNSKCEQYFKEIILIIFKGVLRNTLSYILFLLVKFTAALKMWFTSRTNW